MNWTIDVILASTASRYLSFVDRSERVTGHRDSVLQETWAATSCQAIDVCTGSRINVHITDTQEIIRQSSY